MEFELYELEATEQMQKSLDKLDVNLSRIIIGRANPQILDAIKIDYFGSLTPINQVSSISVPEPSQLLIKPFDRSLTKEIIKAINFSSLGITATDEGDRTRITFPQPTTEKRRELVKSLSKYAEEARIMIRGVRKKVNKQIKIDQELTEDQIHDYLEAIQKTTNNYILQVENKIILKEKSLMKI